MKAKNSQNSHNFITECNICPHFCKLKEGQSGYCHIRKNTNGKVVLTSYGYNTGLNIDPVEKKPLYHFYPASKVLSFGTIGCNLGCKFCQNWQSSRAKGHPELMNFNPPKEIAEIAHKYDCKSVAFTYNEPIIFYEYAIDTAKECKKLGISTIAVTAGYINPEPRKKFFENMDAVNVDLKAFSEDFYKKNCAVKLAPILDTIRYIKNETDCWLELTTLIIEGENDSKEEMKQECNWILENLGDSVPLHLSAFHPAYKFSDRKATSPTTLIELYNIAKDCGLKHVYTGNIIDKKTNATYCSNCKNSIIERDSYLITKYELDDSGRCNYCKTKCEGHF